MEHILEDAYALQIEYNPVAVDIDKIQNQIDALKVRATTCNWSQWENEIRSINSHRICQETVSLIMRKDIALMSDAQLVFMPLTINDKIVYYALDVITDVDALLQLKYHPFTNTVLTDDDIDWLSKIKAGNLYPKIEVGDFFEEVRERLLEPQVYTEKRYYKMMTELANRIETLGFKFEADQVYNFATELLIDRYNLFLKHKPINQKIIGDISRDEASVKTLNYILTYLDVQNIEQKNIETMCIGKAIDEFIYMIHNKLTYSQLLEDRGFGSIKELYWKPNFIVEDYFPSGDIKSQYYVDENGIKNGWSKQWYQNGSLAIEMYYEHGKQHGSYTMYYGNGNICIQGSYIEDCMGTDFTYYPNKIIASKQNSIYDDQGIYLGERNIIKNKDQIIFCDDTGSMDGIYITFFNGYIESSSCYRMNEQTGEYISWYDNGNLLTKGRYAHDHKQGLWQTWYDDGNLRKQVSYDTGFSQTWYHNGKLSIQGWYKNGVQSGKWETWNDNGQLSSQGCYENGVKSGIWETWNDNGQLSSQGCYQNGVKNGTWKTWYTDGKLQSETFYESGKRVGCWQSWHENGILECQMHHIDDKREGLYQSWYTNGTLLKYGNYVGDKQQGTWKTNRNNGVLESEGNYVDDYQHGIWKRWYSNGALESEGEYYCGHKNGIWKGWYNNGAQFSEYYYSSGLYHGLLTRWYSNGQICLRGDYNKDKPVGPWNYYYYNGIYQHQEIILILKIYLKYMMILETISMTVKLYEVVVSILLKIWYRMVLAVEFNGNWH